MIENQPKSTLIVLVYAVLSTFIVHWRNVFKPHSVNGQDDQFDVRVVWRINLETSKSSVLTYACLLVALF